MEAKLIMKKMVSLVLALILALSAAAVALADITPSQVVGTWYLQSRNKYDEAFILDADYRIELNRNKTALVVMNSVERQYTWEIQGDSVYLRLPEDAEYSRITSGLKLEDGLLKMETEYDFSLENSSLYDFVFGREKPVVSLPAWEHKAQTEEDFYGDYELTLIAVPADKTFQKVEKGTMELALSFAELKVTENGESKIVMTDYQDGVLLVDGSDIRREFKSIALEISLDEGVLMANVLDEEGGVNMSLYFDRISADEPVGE